MLLCTIYNTIPRHCVIRRFYHTYETVIVPYNTKLRPWYSDSTIATWYRFRCYYGLTVAFVRYDCMVTFGMAVYVRRFHQFIHWFHQKHCFCMFNFFWKMWQKKYGTVYKKYVTIHHLLVILSHIFIPKKSSNLGPEKFHILCIVLCNVPKIL